MNKTYLLVLGARCTEDGPGRVLAARLRRAALIIDARCRAGCAIQVVVSGDGEAECMARWLIDHGVDPSKIAKETQATSTNENLENAHRMFPEAGEWLVVTSDYHVWRTRVWAWHLGIPVHVIAARTPAGKRMKNYSRELFACPHSLLRVAWRKLRHACS